MKNDTPDNWRSTNPILDKGEVGCAIDSNKGIVTVKVGDGVHPWNELELKIGTKEEQLRYLGDSASEAMKRISKAASMTGVSLSEAISALQSLYACGLNNQTLESLEKGTQLQQKQAETLHRLAQAKIHETEKPKKSLFEDFEIPHYDLDDIDIKNLMDF